MRCIALALAVAIVSAAPGQDGVALDPGREPAAFRADLDASVPGLLEDYLTPGTAVALIVDGHVAWIAGYGYADVAAKRPVTADTVFNIGSISKTVAAWGVLELVEAGKVDLDAPVETYLTRWHLPESDFDPDGVTVRRLLSHTAGLSLHGYPGFVPEQTLPSIEQSLSGMTNGSGDVRQIMPPGTQWKYSGGGYTIAQLVIEEVTGEAFPAWMDRAVLQPLGMTTSAYGWPERIERKAATPHDRMGRPIPGPRFTALAAAGFQTTAADMARFVEASLEPGSEPAVLETETVRLMQRPASDVSPNYGLGYSVRPVADGVTFVGHGGANRGWMADVGMLLESGDGLVVLTNGSFGAFVHRHVRCKWRQWLTATEETCQGAIGPVVVSTAMREGVDAAVRRYRELRDATPGAYDFGVRQLNEAGYALLQAGRAQDAVAIFELNVEAYPDAWNPWDSLGEACAMTGDLDRAIECYARSVELNPKNTDGGAALWRLRQKKKAATKP